jgi:hypothetical protein
MYIGGEKWNLKKKNGFVKIVIITSIIFAHVEIKFALAVVVCIKDLILAPILLHH